MLKVMTDVAPGKFWGIAAVGALTFAALAVWSPIVGLTAALAALLLLLTWLRPFYVLVLLILGLMFHVFATRISIGLFGLDPELVGRLALWKEGMMVLLTGMLAVRRAVRQDRFRLPLYPFDLGLACVALVMSVYVLVTPRLSIGVFGLRNYLEPLIILYLLRAVPTTRRDLTRLIGAMLAVSVVVALFGIYQATFWGFSDLYNWGFRDADGTIPNAFYMAVVERQPRLRAVSTVTSPNELGLLMQQAILLCVVLFTQRVRPLWQKALLVGVAAINSACLLFTFSRSSFIALVVGVIALALLQRAAGWQKWGRIALDAVRSPGTMLVLVSLIVLMGIGAERVGLIARFARALTLRDPSAAGHLASFQVSIPFIWEHPMGIGMGMAGPRALRFEEEVKIEHVESSYFQMMIEIGVPGSFLVIGVLLLMVWTLRRQSGKLGGPLFEGVNSAAQAAWWGAMAAFAVLPLMQELQLMAYLWLLTGVPLRARVLEE